MGKKVALYARVSTRDQTPENQLLDLRRFCESRGFEVYKEYVDSGVSGVKESRPALNALLDDARKKKFDAVLVWRFDRFARSVKHLVTALNEFKNLGIDFLSFQENIDTSSPMGEFIFTVFGALAQMEREIIVERVKSGLRRAVSNGKRLGRPKVEFSIPEAAKLRGEGKSMQEIGDFFGVSKSTISRMLMPPKIPFQIDVDQHEICVKNAV